MTPSTTFVNDVVALCSVSFDGQVLDCNDACARILGYANREELMAEGSFNYVNRSDVMAVAAALRDLRSLENVELALRRRDGSVAWVLQNLQAGVGDVIDVAMFDVTEQRVASQRFEYQAYHDGVTGLPNRMLFVDRATVAMAQARRRGAAAAIVVADIPELASITARNGRGFADRVLRAVGERIAATIREEDAVARLDENSFMILLAGMPAANDAAIAANRLLERLSEPMRVGDESFRLSGHLGIAIANEDGDQVETLVRKAAEAAGGAAGPQGGNSFRFYQTEMNARAAERATMVARLRRAVDDGELEVHYQPQVNVQTGTIECIEALLRWRHPDLGLIPSAQFLPAAEQGGLLNAITEVVIAKSLRQLREWQASGHPQMRIGLNLLAHQLGERGIPALFAEGAAEFGISPSMIEIEFPESSLTNRATADTLRALKEYQMLLAIDDFGTGGCGITDLKRLPVDTIKIAPHLIRNMVDHSDDAAIVQAMITMARALNLRVVAEGVETKEQFSFLQNRRCNEMQGYFIARPVPAFALDDMLRMQSH